MSSRPLDIQALKAITAKMVIPKASAICKLRYFRVFTLESSSSHRLEFVDSYRAVAILMVIATHTFGYSHLLASLKDTLYFLVSQVAVPIFFFIDGLLFAKKQRESVGFNYGRYIAKSARRLLIPWAAFIVLYTSVRALAEFWGWTHKEIIIGKSFIEMFAAFYHSTAGSHLYFLLSLFLVRLCAKISCIFSRLSPSVCVMPFLSYTVAYASFDITPWFVGGDGPDPVLNALWGMQFYLLGVAINSWSTIFNQHAILIASVCGVLTIGGWISNVGNALVMQYSYLIGTYTFFVAAGPLSRALAEVGKHTMGIYVLHSPLVIYIVASLLASVIPRHSLTYFLCVTIGTYLISFFLSRLIEMNSFGTFLLGPLTASRKRRHVKIRVH